jgi:hypothetical protein
LRLVEVRWPKRVTSGRPGWAGYPWLITDLAASTALAGVAEKLGPVVEVPKDVWESSRLV